MVPPNKPESALGAVEDSQQIASAPIFKAIRVSTASGDEQFKQDFKLGGVAVALSGGRDSVVLLHALRALGVTPLRALTVNHQLQESSGSWATFCADLCARFDVAHQIDEVTVTNKGDGIEGAARRARYASLTQMAKQSDCKIIGFGHHQDDQVETVLHQLLRGTGLAGAAGMASLRFEQGLWIWRPLLSVTRAQIDAYASAYHLQWVDDPSNADTHFARNAIRKDVLPVIDQYFAAGRQNIVRFAQLLAQSDAQIQAIAFEDLAACTQEDPSQADPSDFGFLDVVRVRALSSTRQAWVLRAWLKQAGLKMPSQARLQSMQRQLVQSQTATQAGIAHDDAVLRRYRNVLSIHAQTNSVAPLAVLYENPPDEAVGLPAHCLANAQVESAPRTLSQNFRLGLNRPNRSLKLQFQAVGIAPWQRQQSVALYRGDDLLWVAGLGMNHQWVVATGDRKVPRLA